MNLAATFSLAVLLVLPTTVASALSGAELYQKCSQKRRNVSDISCIAYVRGFVDGMMIGTILGKEKRMVYCPPTDGLAVDQARLIIEKYLKDHPEKLRIEAGYLVGEALVSAFPCPSN